jgi:flagellar hook protein FlgE
MDVFGIAASGLQANQALLNVAANNIANANTPGYLTQTADLADISTGGVSVEGIDQTNQPVDLATETIAQKNAAVMYDANALVIKLADQMYGSLLNVLDTQSNDTNPDGTQKY